MDKIKNKTYEIKTIMLYQSSAYNFSNFITPVTMLMEITFCIFEYRKQQVGLSDKGTASTVQVPQLSKCNMMHTGQQTKTFPH